MTLIFFSRKFPTIPIMSDPVDKTELNAEVLWCIQHLETMMSSGKLSEKKGKEARTCYKLIRNPGTPLPKLRQAMRTSCGDYKAKMKVEAEQEVKLGDKKILSASVPKSQCNFIKKSNGTLRKLDEGSSSGGGGGGEEFKFNFTIDP